ncbi:hypothetical protein FRB90_006052 [Tulasnella sp. 427]|nr:hypothetical protein FRB90_006052 [Tulasnella sp. 427]
MSNPTFAEIYVSKISTPGHVANVPRPAHHANESGTLFKNPWQSYRQESVSSRIKSLCDHIVSRPAVPEDLPARLGLRKPDFGYVNSTSSEPTNANRTRMKATWLGHACFLLELPSPEGASRGPRILFDPVFSQRYSPVTFVGPTRHTQPPCKLEELPSVDIVVISHNHYDHLDTHSVAALDKLFRPHFFAPLNNESYFKSVQVPEERTHILDWWDARNVTVAIPAAVASSGEAKVSKIRTTFEMTCTPAQHSTRRSLTDRFHALWSSWAVRDPASGKNAWFGGDTGYRTVHSGENEDDVPVCPEFKKIGEMFGGFDLPFIPIGAYGRRGFTSGVHCAPQDSVRVFKDIQARKAIGMHWG